MKKQYGLIGFPLGHSFSASYFAGKFSRENIDAEYVNFPMEVVDGLRDFVRDNPHLAGFNVTIPHKQAVIPLLDDLSIAANEIGAVNVVKVVRDEEGFRLVGYNTDHLGFAESLRPLLTTDVRRALVLGTGGASRAVVYALKRMDIVPQLVSRHKREGILAYDDIDAQTLRDFPLVVNCTPLGMFPKVDAAPPIPYEHLSASNIFYDLVYNPDDTKFMRLGRSHGAKAKNGLEMLHLQAEAAWNIWKSEKIL